MADPKRKLTLGFLLTVAAGLVVERWKDFSFLKWLSGATAAAAAWLRESYLIERWYLGVLALMGIGFVVSIAKRLLRTDTSVPWLTYRQGVFFGLRWSWDYIGHQFDSGSLQAYCPKCDLLLSFTDAAMFAAVPRIAVVCGDCGYRQEFAGDLDSLRDRILRLAERNVRTKDRSPRTDG